MASKSERVPRSERVRVMSRFRAVFLQLKKIFTGLQARCVRMN